MDYETATRARVSKAEAIAEIKKHGIDPREFFASEMASLDPDFRREPKTKVYCVNCQKDIKDASKALRVTVDWDTWQVALGGNELLGRDCAKRIGLLRKKGSKRLANVTSTSVV